MRAQERSEPRHAQAERPNGTDTCRVAPTERSSGRASAVSNTYRSRDQASERSHPEKAPSGAKNPDRRGLDFDGEVSEIRSSSRPTACWRSWYAAALCRFLLSSMVFVTVPFLVFPLGLSCACSDSLWCGSRLLSLAVFGFLPGGGHKAQAALGILHQGARHLSARTSPCQSRTKIFGTSLTARGFLPAVLFGRSRSSLRVASRRLLLSSATVLSWRRGPERPLGASVC